MVQQSGRTEGSLLAEGAVKLERGVHQELSMDPRYSSERALHAARSAAEPAMVHAAEVLLRERIQKRSS